MKSSIIRLLSAFLYLTVIKILSIKFLIAVIIRQGWLIIALLKLETAINL